MHRSKDPRLSGKLLCREWYNRTSSGASMSEEFEYERKLIFVEAECKRKFLQMMSFINSRASHAWRGKLHSSSRFDYRRRPWWQSEIHPAVEMQWTADEARVRQTVFGGQINLPLVRSARRKAINFIAPTVRRDCMHHREEAESISANSSKLNVNVSTFHHRLGSHNESINTRRARFMAECDFMCVTSLLAAVYA